MATGLNEFVSTSVRWWLLPNRSIIALTRNKPTDVRKIPTVIDRIVKKL
jgi:hypothetical protein